MSDVTRILNAIEAGDTKATDQLLPLVYEELRILAAQKLSREKPGQTLQATALVHEAYMRLVGNTNQNWDNQGHFFAAAAEAMRRILIDNARRKHSHRHGGRHRRIDLDQADLASERTDEDFLALNEALERLEDEDPHLARIVKLRYFAGLTNDQIARIEGSTRRTIDRHWALGRAWLYQVMNGENGGIQEPLI